MLLELHARWRRRAARAYGGTADVVAYTRRARHPMRVIFRGCGALLQKAGYPVPNHAAWATDAA